MKKIAIRINHTVEYELNLMVPALNSVKIQISVHPRDSQKYTKIF